MRATRSVFTVCLLALLALLPSGCATRQQNLEMETAFKERMTKMEAGLAAEKKRADELTTQLNAVRATATEAQRTATEATRIGTEATRIGTEARQRADAAATKGDAVDARVTNALASRFKRTMVREFRVTFETGKADLSGAAQQALLGAVQLMKDNPTYSVDVVGYTDDVGATGSNVMLSWRREEMVRRFMVERGGDLNRFSFIGLGEDQSAGRTEAGRSWDRHVLVRIYRPAD
jgi:outer membrane protein OmpA-like peptidoglycan-associated protein